jgi:hypothetical protein
MLLLDVLQEVEIRASVCSEPIFKFDLTLLLDVLQDVARTPSGAKFTAVVTRKKLNFDDQVKPVLGANGPLDVVWWLPERKPEWVIWEGQFAWVGENALMTL